MLNVEKIREDFPILKRKINGKPLVYFDNAATSQKPKQVIEALKEFYEKHNANVFRGVHTLSEEATEKYEEARRKIAEFINAENEKEIIFTRSTTEAINLVLYGYAIHNLKAGDEIISTIMEHHSNIVPWQFLQERGVKLKFVDIDDKGNLKLHQYNELITKNTKLITVTHVSNVLGTINPIDKIEKIAHDNGALYLVDGAQSVPHLPIDVQKINCDFLVFSGHKMLGPTGIGVLYAKKEILEKMKPFNYGSEMIKEVYLDHTIFADLPLKFEAGTPNIAGAIALGVAVDYLKKIGMKNIAKHEEKLTQYTLKKMKEIEEIKIFGEAKERAGVISFNLADIHPHDLATILDEDAIAVRSGHHCAMPLMNRLGVVATTRASFYLYNTKEEVDRFVNSLEKARKVFKL
ncbi:MAG: cysteine desulfurase [Candidatus Aenigmatarchaeota archaeon]